MFVFSGCSHITPPSGGSYRDVFRIRNDANEELAFKTLDYGQDFDYQQYEFIRYEQKKHLVFYRMLDQARQSAQLSENGLLTQSPLSVFAPSPCVGRL